MSRKALAFAAGAQDAADRPTVDPENIAGAGNWSRQAAKGMAAQVEEAREDARRAASAMHDGILQGTIPIIIPRNQIFDEVGSDRIAQDADPDFEQDLAALTENIRERGLKTPIRVRPADPEWRPLQEDPQHVVGQTFFLQSGRRRLAACAKLGIDPIAFISFVDGDASLDDLLERYFENVARKDLTIVERLVSIAAIAEKLDGSQVQIAKQLNIPRPTLNRAMRFMQHYAAAEGKLNFATATRNEIDAFLAKQSEGGAEARQKPKARAPLPFRKKTLPGGSLTLRQRPDGGRKLVLDLDQLSDHDAIQLAATIEGAVKKL